MKNLTKLLRAQEIELGTYFNELDDQINNNKDFKSWLGIMMDLIQDTNTLNTKQERAIYFTGIGKNDTIAKKSANMFRSLNFNAHHLSPVDAMHGDMGLLYSNDVIIAISKSGNTTELIHFLKYVKSFRSLNIFGIQIGSKESAFDEQCDYNFHLPDLKEIDEWNIVPTMSNIAPQLFLDMAAINCANMCNLQLKSFKESHPGGAIGAS